MGKALDPTQIASLIKEDDEQSRLNQATRIKRKSITTEPRTYEVWFRLAATFDECSNPECIDPRDNKVGKAMVAEVNGGKICRYCFLAGVNKVTA